MFTRTRRRIVHFQHAFTLKGVEGVHPPGDYQVEDDEEQINGITWLAYRRIATTIEIHDGNKTQFVPVDPVDLDAALAKDVLAVAQPVVRRERL